MPGSYNFHHAGTTPHNGPYYVEVNGLHGFSLADLRGGVYRPVLPNDERFTSLAIAINIGLEMLESLAGRMALSGLGRALVYARAQTPDGRLLLYTRCAAYAARSFYLYSYE
ncbi:hypothetical protein F5B22DRAFT_653542 [Xylaria bambusicola]|uniref:uncharacterized protein n=1 Tax=Xylaria bambusicola TaxID=326684 RepID=UPI0020077B0D|nr:uncharacterized protein F5B22DRAFT_653542 [Xylaria bambusicola]KAI0521167.1 hypothetical protein F5B22DRAFT_653542 [Xylaria bambusicola]